MPAMRPAASHARGAVAALAAVGAGLRRRRLRRTPRPRRPVEAAAAVAASPVAAEAPSTFPEPARAWRGAPASSPARAGVRSFALIDSRGRLYGYAPRRAYVSASVTKAMLLVAYLRAIGRRAPTAAEKRAARPDDHRLGQRPGRRRVRPGGRRRAAAAWRGVPTCATSPRPATGPPRASPRVDQARFFLRVDRLVPEAQPRPTRAGCSRPSCPYERWGFSRYAARAGYRTFFKGGWRGTASGRLVHEAALFQHGRTRFAMAVLTRRQPHARLRHRDAARRGRADLRAASARAPRRGAASRPALRRAGLEDVLDRAPGIRVELAYGSDAQPHRPAACPATAARGPTCCGPAARDLAKVQRGLRRARPRPPGAATPTGPPAPRGRSCAGRAGAGAPSSWAPTSRGGAATTSAAPWT